MKLEVRHMQNSDCSLETFKWNFLSWENSNLPNSNNNNNYGRNYFYFVHYNKVHKVK